MADTVKKSRIVSDDEKDLEESLLEEFNIRLKNCMSQDDLQKDPEPPEPDDTYENILTTPPQKTSPKKHIVDTDVFLQTEIQENYYDEPKLSNGTPTENGHGYLSNAVHEEQIYECIPEKTENSDQNYVQMLENKVADSKRLDLSLEVRQIVEYEPMELEETSSNLYESVEIKSQHAEAEKPENNKQTPTLNLPITCFTDYSDEKSPDKDQKCSAKDRMLLSCDETSTLLFTQTVTSPMLTPSEENIDFLKGFQRDNTASESTVSNSSPPKDSEEKYEATETSPDVSDPLEEEKVALEENFYENTEFYKNTTPENMYENVTVKGTGPVKVEADEGIYEQLEVVKGNVEQLKEVEKVEPQEIDIYQNIEEALQKTGSKSQDTDDASLEEFIRYEKEVSDGFLVNKVSTESSVDPAVSIEEVKTETVTDEDVVDRVASEVNDKVIDVELPPFSEKCFEEDREISEEVPLKQNGSEEEEIRLETKPEIVTQEAIVEVHKVEEVVTNGHKTVELTENVKNTFQTYHETTIETVETSIDSASTDSTIEPKDKISSETYKDLIYHQKSESNSNYYEKYTEVLSKNSKNDSVSNREKDTETVPSEIVKNLKSQFQNKVGGAEVVGIVKKGTEIKSANMINQIKTKFEGSTEGCDVKAVEDSTEYSETIVETNAPGERIIKKKKVKKTRKEEKENISVNENGHVDGENFYNVNVKNLKERFNSAGTNIRFKNAKLKSSFSKFDALQKKNVLHVRSSDSTKAQEKFSNGAQIELSTNCKACGKQVFQMEQIKAERSLWHKNCFRCTECSKQLTVDTYESNDGSLYCKPHFKALFAPKAVEEDSSPSDKPDLGLEELQSLNVKERFQVFEQYQSQHTETSDIERGVANVKRSPSILSKLAKFQKHGMDVGVSNEALDGIPIEESESDEEEVDEEIPDGEDPDLVRAKRVQKEKPFHFTGMSDVKKRWEQGDHAREERREETKQEIQNIRTRLFMGKQEKMKEAYQQAVSESSTNLRQKLSEKIEACDTKSIKDRFEKGENANERTIRDSRNEEEEVYESEMSKNSRSLFLELDASASKAPQLSPVTPPKLEVKKAREAYLEKTAKEDTVKSTEQVEDIEVRTADIQERFKFFETYREPEKEKKQFRITPPRDPSQLKAATPEREIYRDPDVVRNEEAYVDDSSVAKESHTASKMLNKFRQLEESFTREPEIQGPKPLKRFTPPPEPTRPESRSEEGESSEYEEEEEEEEEVEQNGKLPEDLIEAQKAARAKQLRAKFEKWEANEIKKEQQTTVNIVEEFGEEQSQVESTRVLRARFEQMRDTSSDSPKSPRVKPNRFVEIAAQITETCQSCNEKVYPLEKVSIHGNIYHKGCFKCMECSCVLRMDSYSYNQGLLYCTPHFKRLFISKGNYDSAFGLDQHKEKWQNSVNNMTVA